MSTQEKRKITIFSTKGSRKKEIETDVTTWGELKPLVTKEGYDMGSLHATENITRHDLAHEGAVLPTSAFTLFLRPVKTKSGGKDYSKMGFKELRAELTEDDKKQLTESTGKNWTRCSTDDLIEYLSTKSESPEVIETFNSEEAEITEETNNNVGDVVNAVASLTNMDRVNSVEKMLSDISENTDSQEVKERVDLVLDEVEGLKEAVENDESPDAVAARKAEEQKKQQEEEAERQRIAAEKAEEERLAKEANDLMKGFK